MSDLLLCTDLDRTLIPNGPQSESPHARDYFYQLVKQQHVTLAYVTGRDRQLVEDAIREYSLPVPDYVIADVGSSIYKVTDNDWQQLSVWQQKISSDWNRYSAEQITGLLNTFTELRLQESSRQNSFKISYYVDPEIDNILLAEKILSALKQYGIEANIIWSIDELKAAGLLDILPATANKRHAIEFLMEYLGFSYAQTVFAGDSGNDIDVMVSPVNSVLVANASDDVKQAALQQAKEYNQLNSLYIAHGCDFPVQMNGNYSAGILEGVMYYLPELKHQLGNYL